VRLRFALCWTRSRGDERSHAGHRSAGTTMIGIHMSGKAPSAGTMEKTRPIADVVIKRYKERYGT